MGTEQFDAPKPIACGVPVFTRARALQLFLESVPAYVDTVYIADNSDRGGSDIRPESHAVDVEILRLPYDCGIGQCRAAITDACSEPYLWMGDCDMQITREGDLKTLRRVLEANPDLGGVSGWLIEDRAVRAGARDLRIHGQTAIKEAADLTREPGPVPFARADFIPQAGLFRTEIYDEYNYDPTVRNSEHFDFFYAHKQLDAWDFASTPAVVTIHNRNIDREYRETERGGNHVDIDILARKWGVERIEPGAQTDWAEVTDRGLDSHAFDLVKRTTPPNVWLPIKRAAERVGLA